MTQDDIADVIHTLRLEDTCRRYDQTMHDQKDIRRQIRKLKAALDQQEKTEEIGHARDNVKEVSSQIKELKREIRLHRFQRDEMQLQIDKQAESLLQVHNVSHNNIYYLNVDGESEAKDK